MFTRLCKIGNNPTEIAEKQGAQKQGFPRNNSARTNRMQIWLKLSDGKEG